MKTKILFSTKLGFDYSSDLPGGSLPIILFAEYFSKNTNFDVTLYDPFFNLKNIIKSKINIIDRINKEEFGKFDRYFNPFFYISEIEKKKNQSFLKYIFKDFEKAIPNKIKETVFFENDSVEGRNTWDNFINLKVKDVLLYQKKGFSASYKNNYDLYFKTLNIPYVHYYDLLSRENFICNIKLKKNKKLPIKKNKLTFTIQIRPEHHIEELDCLKGKDYLVFIKMLIIKLKTDFNNPNIIVYGINGFEKNIKEILNLIDDNKLIYLEKFSSNTVERALLISKYTDYLLCTNNGFSFFSYLIGSTQKKIKDIFVINSLNKASPKNYNTSRRLLYKAINEDKSSYEWFNTFKYLPKDSFLKLNKTEILSSRRLKNTKLLPPKQTYKVISYDINDQEYFYFTKQLDNILYEDLKKEIAFDYDRRVVNISEKKNPLKIELKREITKNLNLLVYSNIRDSKNKSKLGINSIDFVKHKYLKKLQNQSLLNPSNYIFEDLGFYIIRKILSKNRFTYNNFSNNVRKVLIVSKPSDFYENDYQKRLVESMDFKITFVYLDEKKDKLILIKKKNLKYIEIKKNNILNLINQSDATVCLQNKLSLIFNYLNNNKNMVLYHKGTLEPVFSEKKILYSHTKNINYKDLYLENFESFYELMVSFKKDFLYRA